MRRLLLILLLSAFSSVPVAAYNLPDTGQTTCYDTANVVTACAGTGQDGAYSNNPISYTDHGNGTVTDDNTGLMWQKCSIGQNNDASCSGAATTYNWLSSQNACSALSLGGYTDWRLPAKKELMSLVDYGIGDPGPTITGTFFPNTDSSKYWSSTTTASYTLSAWAVNFFSGEVEYSLKSGDSSVYVRCVRGGQEETPNLVNNGNGTVTDTRTGLVWQQGEAGAMTWGNALSYCEGFSLGGHSDWRLPDVKELESLTDDTMSSPAVNASFFPNTDLTVPYWTSSTDFNYLAFAWYVDYNDGYVSYNDKGSNFAVRCVYGGHSGAMASLTVSISGTGTGSVHSSPAGISCPGTCVAPFAASPPVTLYASPEASCFSQWTGACSGNGSCSVTVDANKTVNAEFAGPVRVGTTLYPSLTAAYGAASLGSSIEMEVIAVELGGGFNLNRNVTVLFTGGQSCAFTPKAEMTTIDGIVTVGQGQITAESLAVK
jgi:hypothetical protein